MILNNIINSFMNNGSTLIMAIVVITIAIFFVALIALQKKTYINKFLGILSVVAITLTMFTAIISVNAGTIYLKTSGSPEEVVNSFISAVNSWDEGAMLECLYGIESFGDNDAKNDALADIYVSTLRSSYVINKDGVISVDGQNAKQSFVISYADISYIAPEILSYINQNIITEPTEDEVELYYDEDGVYRSSYIDSLFAEGIQKVKNSECPFVQTNIDLEVNYIDGKWYIMPSNSLINIFKGKISADDSVESASIQKKYDLDENVINAAANDKGSIYSEYLADHHEFVFKKVYSIEKGATPPKPDPAGYYEFSYEEAGRVMELVDKAKEFGLLEDEDVLYSPNASFRNRGTIQCYLDETILVIMWKELIDGKILTLSEIKIADPSQFRRKIADDVYGSATQYYCSELTKQVNSVVSLNSDFYGFRSQGITCYEGEIHRTDTTLDTLFIDENGDFLFYDRHPNPSTEEEKAALKEELQKYVDEHNIDFSLSFGPVLIKDGVVQNCSSYPIGQVNEKYSRSSISQLGNLHYLYCNVAYASADNPGCELNMLAKFLSDKGVKQAYNLDGGQTSEIIFNGKIYNLLNYDDERTVSDIVYFATALPESER